MGDTPVKRTVHLTFSRPTTMEPDRPGFDTTVYEQELLRHLERNAIDAVQQMINEGLVMPSISIEREDGTFVEPDPTYVSDLAGRHRGRRQGILG